MPTILAKECAVRTSMISTPLVCNGFGVLSTPPFLQCNDYTLLYLLNQTPQLLFTSLHNFVWFLFESSYYLKAAFIKFSGISKIFCEVAADARESI